MTLPPWSPQPDVNGSNNGFPEFGRLSPWLEFKEARYRRIAYASTHWGGNRPGWKPDRSRMYIRYGPPDEIDSHPSGGSYKRPEAEGGGSVMTCPFRNWRYAHCEGLGSLSIEFVDRTSSGVFRMTLDPKRSIKSFEGRSIGA